MSTSNRPSARRARLAMGLAVALLTATCGKEREPPLNVVIVVIDTLRPDHLGLHGHPRPTSPQLDRFARSAAVLENAQAPSPWTAPSLLTLMTSLLPYAHGAVEFPNPRPIPERATTLAALLSERGYATGAFTEGGFAKAAFGLGRGFDVYPEFPGDAGTNASNLYHPSRLEENLGRALTWLGANHHKPFLLFFHTYEVHTPYRAPEPWVRALRPGYDERREHAALAAAVERWNAERRLTAEEGRTIVSHSLHCDLAGLPLLEDQAKLAEVLTELGLELEPRTRPVDEGLVAFARDQYDAEIAYTDAQLARLWDALDALDVSRRTLVIVTSDHGEAFGEHGLLGHGQVLHEELLRIPLLVRGPGIAPARLAEPASLADVLPTVLDLLGVPAKGIPMQGRSLAQLLRGQAPDGDAPPAFGQGINVPGEESAWSSVRTHEWRLIERDGEVSALHHLPSDPREQRDVAAEHPQALAELRAHLAAQRERDARLRAWLGAQGPRVELDEAALRELRQLGYVDAKPGR